MIFTILTLFPDMFDGFLTLSILKKAQEKYFIKVNIINIRDFSKDSYKTVDDHPYGGGVGMVMKVDVIDRALEFAKQQVNESSHTILLDPKGITFTQNKAKTLSLKKHVILVSGHYEGVDARVDELVDEKISIGNYVLTGGELPAAVIVDSVTRLVPGVLKNETATQTESFSVPDVLEAPQYTRPPKYKGMSVPEILRSGDHQKIDVWKLTNSKKIK